MSTPEIGIKLVLDGKEYRVAMTAAASDTKAFGETTANAMRTAATSARSLDSATAQVAQFQRGLQAAGVSAAQTAAAMRQLPAQFTDIVTSLGSGQNPFTVLLQQGGQIKDSFGGVGAAARALGGYVAGLVNPFTIAAAAVGGLAFAYERGASESANLRRSLILSGQAVEASSGQLQDMARQVSLVVGTQGAATEAIAALATTGRVSYAQLGLATEVAVRAQRELGTKVEDTAKIFGELAGEPVKASLKLDESVNFLTASTLKQIVALDQQGRSTEAARVAQDAYANTLKQRLSEAEANLGIVERAWRTVTDAAKGAWDAMLGIGRTASLGDQLAAAQTKLAQLQAGAGESRTGLLMPGQSDPRPGQQAALQAQIEGLQEMVRLENRATAAKRESADLEQARKKWLAEGLEFQTKSQKMQTEIAAAQVLGNAAGLTQAKIEERIAEIRAKYAEKGGDNAAKRELEERAKLLAELGGLSGSFAKDWDRLSQLYKNGALSLEQLIALQAVLLGKQPAMTAAAHEEAKAREELEKQLKAEEDARAKVLRGLGDQIDAQRLSNEEIGLTRDELARLKIGRLEDALATKEQTLALAELSGASDGQLQQMRDEIRLMQQLVGLKKDAADKERGVEAEKDAAKRRSDALKEYQREAQRVADTVDRALTDGLMRGFEAGKGFAENFRDTLVNMFKTLVLRPVLSFVLSPLTGTISSVLGTGGGTAGSNILSSLGGFGGGGGESSGSLMAGGFTQAAQAAAAREALLTAGQYVAGAGVGIGVGNAVSGGYGSRGVVMAGTAIGAAVGGPIGAAIGGTLAGIANRAFGSKSQETTATGVEGTFNSAGFSGRQFADWRIQGGWFSRDRSGRDFSALTPQQQALLSGGVNAAPFSQLAQLAGMGSRSDQLAGWSFTTSRAIATDEDVKKLLVDVSDSLGRTLLPELEQFRADGESLADTAVRLTSVFAATNDIALVLGKTTEQAFGAVGLASAQAREAIIAAAGGLDSFKTATQTYYSKFFTAEEQRAMLAKQLGEQFAALGMALPETRSQFRALVEGLDLTTEGGQKALGALLALSGSVDQYVSATEAQTASIANAADQLASSMKTVSGALWQTIADVTGSQSPGSSLDTLMGRFDAAYATALTSSGSGLADAGKTINDLIEPLLSAAKDYYATGADYQRVFQYATGAATQVAQRLDGSGGGATSQMAALVRLLSESQPATLDELAALRAEFAELRRNLERELSR